MTQYIVLTEVKREAQNVEWWMDQTDNTETAQVFDSFDDAKTAMRKMVKKLANSSGIIPIDSEGYEPLSEFLDGEDEEMCFLNDILTKTILDPKYRYDSVDELDIQCTDDGDWYFAFVGSPNIILADYYESTLKTNIHNMQDKTKHYFFSYCEHDDGGRVINEVNVRLISTARQKKAARAPEVKKYETISFGHYVQDAEGKEEMPLSWRVIDRTDGRALLITEKVIDHIQFFSKDINNWETSDLRRWLNTEFLDSAFNEEEKAHIITNANNERVSLLDMAEYKKYFPEPKDARAGYTDLARKKAEDEYGTSIREPYAFWWLKTANDDGGWGNDGTIYVWHICNNGTANPFERASYNDGVRPVIWVRFD